MQYLKEDEHGQRKPVTSDVYLVDKSDKDFMQIIATDNIVIYRITGMGTREVGRPLKFGGRRRGDGMPWSGA